MNTISSLNNVNPHYLDRVIELSAESPVAVTEDIYSAQGIKLLAKGTRISADMRERLIRHKLKKPLEQCLAVTGGVGVQQLELAIAKILLEDSVAAALLTQSGHLGHAQSLLLALELDTLTSTVLSLAAKGRQNELQHTVEVTLLALVLGIELGLDPAQLSLLAQAGMLHDVGVLYINPDYVALDDDLTPEQWKHIVVHPLIGKMVLDEVAGYPSAVVDAVVQHHERLDGGGYPHRLRGEDIGLAASLLGAADSLCSIRRSRRRALARADVALRIVPRQFPPLVVAFVNRLVREHASESPTCAPTETTPVVAEMINLFTRIGLISCQLDALADTAERRSDRHASQLLEQVTRRFDVVQRAFSSTGLDVWPRPAPAAWLMEDADGLCCEVTAIVEEIQWRLRELARDLYWRAEAMPAAGQGLFTTLIGLLHDGRTVAAG